MPFDIKDKVVLITGATRGLGEAMAIRFAAEGARVAVAGRTLTDGTAVADRIVAAGGVARYVRLDLADEACVAQCVRDTVAAFGGLDVLVNNAAPTEHIIGASNDMAGTLTQKSDNSIEDLTTDGWRKVMTAGLDGLFWMIHYAIPELRKRPGSSIVNISTVASQQGVGGVDGYTATKGAMNSLTRSTAVGLAPDVRCNAIVAGMFVTAGLAPMMNDAHIAAAINDTVLTATVGQPEDIAGAAVFLASDDARYITGQLLHVDGGQTIKMALPKLEAAIAELQGVD
jgi:NAD(P)-dependent dehydrogenase (short-subunit alcohol dehydrogenase family)